MNNQRGSVTVIAIVMLLFLMVIAIAWLPMMTMEKTAASSDYREQQAWYAAEAGYKRAVAQLKAGNTIWKDWLIDDNDLKDGTFSVINGLEIEQQSGKGKQAGVLKDGVWYAVAISSATNGTDLKHGERGDGNYTPVQGETYVVTSIGSCQGVRKVIRKDYTIGDNGGSGGGGSVEDPEDPEPPQQENVYLSDALVAANGSVTINFVNGNNSGKIYNNGALDAYGFHKVGAIPSTGVKYYVQEKVFDSSYYKNIQNKADQDLRDGRIITKGDFYYRSADINGSNISVAENSVLLTDGDIKLQNMTINVGSGVLQIIANGKIEINSVKVTGGGQLTVISKGNLTVNNLIGDSKILLIGNTVNFTNPDVTKCFISSKDSIFMQVQGNDKFEYRGQMQAGGSVHIVGNQIKPNDFELHFVKIAEELVFPPMQ